jgi:hypothetical protein
MQREKIAKVLEKITLESFSFHFIKYRGVRGGFILVNFERKEKESFC